MRIPLRKIVLVMGLVILSACGARQKADNQYSDKSVDRPLVDDKYSLSHDREKLDEIRKDIPAEKQTQNDEEATMLSFFTDLSKSPSQVRERFDSMLRKKREQFDKDVRKERETFDKESRKKRDLFLKESDRARKDFLKGKPGREEKSEYFNEQDDKRREFFSDDREKRADFESDLRDRRKDFEDYIKERRSRFNDEYKSYYKKYDEMRKAKEIKKTSEAEQLRKDIEAARSMQGYDLNGGE